MRKAMFHVKQSICLVLCGALLCTAMYKPIKAQAIAPAIPILWEILQTILLSAGVTYLGYETITHVVNNNKYQESYDDILSYLNTQDAGLGQAVDTAIKATGDADVKKVVIPQTVWDRLRGIGQHIATEGTVSTPGMIQNVTTESAQAIVTASVPLIPEAWLPVRDGTKYRTDKMIDVYKTFPEVINYAVANTGLTAPYFHMFYVSFGFANYDEVGMILTYTGTPVSSYRLVRSDGSAPQGAQSSPYLELLDSSGSLIAYGGVYISWDGYNKRWSFDSASSSTAHPRADVTSTRQKVMNTTSEAPSYFGSLFANTAISVPQGLKIDAKVQPTVIGGAYDVVTPGRTQTGTGALEGDVTITIPTTFPVADTLQGVLDGTIPITDALEKLGVIPVDTTKDQTIAGEDSIADAITKVEVIAPTIPEIDNFNLGLDAFFPFCIPFDFAKFLECLSAPAQAPSFTFKFPTSFTTRGGHLEIGYTEYEISLEAFDTVAQVCRTFELLLFIIGLAMLTRQHFINS